MQCWSSSFFSSKEQASDSKTYFRANTTAKEGLSVRAAKLPKTKKEEITLLDEVLNQVLGTKVSEGVKLLILNSSQIGLACYPQSCHKFGDVAFFDALLQLLFQRQDHV